MTLKAEFEQYKCIIGRQEFYQLFHFEFNPEQGPAYAL